MLKEVFYDSLKNSKFLLIIRECERILSVTTIVLGKDYLCLRFDINLCNLLCIILCFKFILQADQISCRLFSE